MKNSKRILSVAIRRMHDDSLDTSYLGEYGNAAKSDYAIDRAHSEDCASVRPEIKAAKQTLEHVQRTIGDLHNTVLAQYNGTLANEKLDAEKDALDEAYDEVGELIDNVDGCDCEFSGHWNNREYRYFNPNHENYKGLPEEEIRKYCRQDFDRAESLNNGDWSYIGIRAEARVIVNEKVIGPVASHGIAQTITSGGLWGVESDSDASHLAEIQRDELANLKAELIALGFSRRSISTAFKSVQERED
jgi:vacuolar-type H+-ATPase subunit E/Vma4